MRSVLHEQDTIRLWRHFAEREALGQSPCYADWASAVATDREVLALIDTLPGAKRQPNLVLAAARWHGAEPGPYARLRRVLVEEWAQVRDTALTRSTQTNEARRCATLRPALSLVPGPISLIEVGASAGLCLLPDRYRYRYRCGDEQVEVGPPSPVVLDCDVRQGSGAVGRPTMAEVTRDLPEVRWRRGIDLAPVRLTPDDVRWLELLVWPGQDERLAVLHAAVDLARESQPEIVAGDLLSVLAQVVSSAPADTTVVVMHSAVAAYLTMEQREQMIELIESLPVRWLSNEGPKVLPPRTGPIASPSPEEALFVSMLDREPLWWSGPHGQSITPTLESCQTDAS